LPNKTLVFDTQTQGMRQRVVEGGQLTAGAEVRVSYTDWRADTLVDASSIDRQIGTTWTSGRFGSFEMPIYGQLVHEVSAGFDLGDGAGFHAEQALTKADASPVVGVGRTAYEARLTPPARSHALQAYFHVRTYLVVDYSEWPNATRWYQDGARILRREKWDNPKGPNTNYAFDLEK
jgi:hypothetical protein